MKKILLFIAAVMLMSCTSNKGHKFTINGSVPSTQFDGKKIYLVPYEGSNKSNVDSTIIKDGQFTFQGDTERICIIKTEILQGLDLQDLLVVTEEGDIMVKMDKNSSCHGTKQNEQLQQWKDAIMRKNHDISLMIENKANEADGKEMEMAKTKVIVTGKQIGRAHV